MLLAEAFAYVLGSYSWVATPSLSQHVWNNLALADKLAF